MKISKRDAQLLIILGGLLIFLALYLLVFNAFQTKADAAAQKNQSLQPQLQQLESEYASLATYQTGIEKYRTVVAQKLKAFPADIKEEDLISYLLAMENSTGISIDSVTFSGSTQLNEFAGVLQKNGKDTSTTMDAYSVGTIVTGQMSYDQMKKTLAYLYASPTQTSLNSLSVSFNAETGSLLGSLDFSRYYVNYNDATYVPEPLPNTPLGVTDLFNSVTPAAAAKSGR